MKSPALMAAARELGVVLDEGQCERLRAFVAEIMRWNARFNLISRKDVARIWPRHVLDSLSIANLLGHPDAGAQGLPSLDLGAGGGFPGIPLAIARPDEQWILVDRNARKVRFLDLLRSALDLSNVRTVCADLGPAGCRGVPDPVGVVVSRAVAAPAELVRLSAGVLAPGGILVLMSGAGGTHDHAGRNPDVQALPAGYHVAAVESIRIPGLDRAHEVTIIRHE